MSVQASTVLVDVLGAVAEGGQAGARNRSEGRNLHGVGEGWCSRVCQVGQLRFVVGGSQVTGQGREGAKKGSGFQRWKDLANWCTYLGTVCDGGDQGVGRVKEATFKGATVGGMSSFLPPLLLCMLRADEATADGPA